MAETQIPPSPESVKLPMNLVVKPTISNTGVGTVYTVQQQQMLSSGQSISGGGIKIKAGDVIAIVDKQKFGHTSFWISDKGLAIPMRRMDYAITDASASSTKIDIPIIATTPTGGTTADALNASPFGKGVRKVQIGFAVVGWSAFGFVAYKNWGKSNLWKAGLIGFALFNAYNTYKIFSKPPIQEGELKP